MKPFTSKMADFYIHPGWPSQSLCAFEMSVHSPAMKCSLCSTCKTGTETHLLQAVSLTDPAWLKEVGWGMEGTESEREEGVWRGSIILGCIRSPCACLKWIKILKSLSRSCIISLGQRSTNQEQTPKPCFFFTSPAQEAPWALAYGLGHWCLPFRTNQINALRPWHPAREIQNTYMKCSWSIFF